MRPIKAFLLGGLKALAAVTPSGFFAKDAVAPGPANCTITFNSAGTWSCTDNLAHSGTWLTGGGTGANYDIRWTNTSGAINVGTAGTWQNLGSNVSFGRTRSGGIGTDDATGTIEIRDAASLTVLASSSLTLEANTN